MIFQEYLTQRLDHLNDSYTSNSLSELMFSYIERDGLATDNRRLLQDISDKSLATHRFNNMNLPITMVPSEYGNIILDKIIQVDGESIHRYIASSNKKLFQIDVSLDGLVNKVTVLGLSDLHWTDTKFTEGFKRDIGRTSIYFVDGEPVLRKYLLPGKPFNKLSVDKTVISKFVTMDIETINVDNKLTPYLICAYDGKDYISSFGKDQNALFGSFFDQLLLTFNKTLIVYAHNLSGFDGVFLLKHLIPYGKVTPLIHNGKLMSITLKTESGKSLNSKIPIYYFHCL
jgi:hypothetical protein